MTKKELSEKLYEAGKFETKKAAAEVVELVLNTIMETVAAGETVDLYGFAKFSAKDTPARVGRNPKTGEEIQIEAKKVVTIKALKVFKDLVNA